MTCDSVDRQSGLVCEKPAGHERLAGRYLHRAVERHTGKLAEVYPASHVHLWGFRAPAPSHSPNQ